MQKMERYDNDIQLWNRLREGDRSSIEYLYRNNYALMLNYGLNITSDKELVKDCIQEIFVKLFKSSSLGEAVSPCSYLLKSVRNMIYDKLSSALVNHECADIEEMFLAIPEDDDFFDSLFPDSDDEIKFKKRLTDALNTLSSQQRQVIYLRFVEGLSHREIADVLGIAEQSSMNLVNRGISKLRTLLSVRDTVLLFMILSHFFKKIG